MRAYELEESAVEELKNRLPKLKSHSYDTIDHLMQNISGKHKITGKKLHDMFVRKYGHTPDTWIKKITNKLGEEDVAEGSYDNDPGIKHTRGSLLAKLEALPRGSDDFEWNRQRAIQHLKQGNMIRAKYYMMLMKRGEQGMAEGLDSQLPQDTLDLIDEYIAKIEPTADRNKMIQDVVDGYIHTSELEYALQEGVAEGEGGNYYSIALQMYPHLKQFDRATVITALNNAYEEYLFHYGYEGIGPDEERSMIDRAIKGLKQGVAEGSLEEYGDTNKGQKMLAKVHHRAADRVTSKQADKDPAYARKAQQTQDRAWERLAVKEQGVAEGSTTRGGFGGSASQAHHEIQWLKNKIETLKPLLAKKPSVARQIKDLERQIRERELAIAYQKEGVAEGSDSYTVANDPDKPGMHSYKEIGHALQNGHSDNAKIYKNNKFLATVGDARQQDLAEGHADQQRKIFKKNGKPVGEVGIDRESSPGNGQWYMTCYGVVSYGGYDSYEEAVEELKHCLKQGVAEVTKKDAVKQYTDIQNYKPNFKTKKKSEPEEFLRISVVNPNQKKSKVSEAVEGPQDIQKIKDFIKWSYKTLNIQKPYPKITISKNTEVAQKGHHTGVHKGNDIWVYVGNRNLIDIFRTIFHELTHHRQMQLNMIKDGDSYPGSPIEMLADMAAGKYLKIYGKEHPEIFQ